MDTAEDLSSVANPDQGWQQQQQLFQQKWPLGTLICKPFDEGDFEGKVESFDPETGYYHIQYEDGDEEDFSAEEMNRFVVAKDNGQKDNADTPMDITDESSSVASLSPVAEVTTTSKRGRLRRKVISYAEADDDDEEEEDSSTDDEAPKPPRKKKNKAKPSSAKKPLEEDEDDDFAEPSDDEDDEMSVDVDYDDDDYLQGRKERPAKTKRAKKEQRDEPADDEESGEKKKKSMAESFMPMNNPLFWKESLNDIQKNHEFLDPCGMEATDDIIDSLVGEQVLKIGKFLEKALMEGNTPNGTLGSEQRPLNLGTACSGTDAPALSLTIVQEQMERYGFSSKLHYNHAFSCEKEPFKQSYLARNFDSILYPDIVKLTDDEPRDVYGRIQQIPKHNQFTAGTSCKNFSLLHSTKRMDIEDKGCSGETFLAAVEHLYKYLPDFCIFENVIGAPWEKMQEYVTGRVALATVYENKKSIQTFTAEEKKIRHLMFKRDGDGNIMTTAVPPQVGVRCGAIVKGFYHGKKLIQDVFWPGKKDECTLDELLRANPKVNRKNDTLVFDAPCTYCTCIQKVDTKDYGLPQTRMRTYMFVWKADDPDNYDDDLGVYWQALVKFLENPVKHSLDAFILDDDHDNIRVFREALRGPPGRHTKRSIFQEPDFYTSSNANVKHNVIARQGLGMDKLTRATTNSGAFGKKQLPPHYWREYLDCQQQRVTDMIDILHAAAARDAETHDSHHSSFFWNLSQNVSKEKHRTATPGIAGCISPGGQFFITNLGRPLLGCEKLLAQGIPYFRLMLGNESEVQVGDLAGNAMSLTVVCATLLANIACRQLRNDYPGKSLKQLLEILNKKARMDHSSTGVLIPQFVPNFGSKTQDASASFASLAALADEAVKSSVWCTCETSGRNSDSSHFLCCSLCRVSCCGSCLGSHSGYQMTSHNAQDIKLSAQEHSLGSFLSKLRDLAPSSLVIDSKCVQYLASLNGKEDVHRVKDLHKFSFNLQKIQRQRRKWVLYYNARDRSGVGEVVASFILSIGEISRESLNENWPPRLGLKGELVSYMPAKTSPFMTGQMKPCAVLTIHAGKQDFEWKALSTPNGVDLTIKGEDPEDSERVELGLLDKADIDLRKAAKNGPQKKFFKDAQNRAESRRWIYAENWKEWPGTVHITSRGCPDVDGTYKRASCRQTINQSALWIRECSSKSPLYLVIKPNVGRTGPDTAIISGSISPDDVSDILVTLPTFWQPCDALSENHTEMEAQKSNWIDATKEMRCIVPLSNVVVKTGERPELLSLHGLSEAQVNMLYPFPSQSNAITLQVHGGVESQKILRSFNYLCVPQIMRHIAKSKSLAHEVSPNTAWKVLSRQEGDPLFGFCSQTIPPPPNEQWLYDQEREAWVRVSNPEESREYYQRLQDAPKSFEFVLNKGESRLSISCFPQIAAHYAAHFLLGGRGLRLSASDSAIVSYRLADASLQSDPSYARFKVYPCSSEAPQNVALKHPFVLYDRQQKVVKKMLKIETGEMAYEEIEMAEHEMPGSTGLSVIAKALRTRKISGGVIADAIGAGKTVVSIALILNGLSEARRSRSLPNKSGATLVVVPCGLIDQWANEINKFTDGLNVLCIYGTEQLRGSTVKQIVESDVVIAPVDIVETRGYTSILAQQSGLQEDLGYAIPALPKTIGHKEKAGASGVWIPASSRDPYGHGANEVKNQRSRELSAFFTHSYMQAIKMLRDKKVKGSDKGIPLEFFEWERVIVDEIHECLVSEKDELELDWNEKNRRASRELLGIAQKDVTKRPLVYRKSIFGLTGTPLLDNSDRVIELANLIGCTYIIGLASHWRKLERESRRDIFLHQFLEPKQSREIRKAIYSKCQEYLKLACCRNTTEKEMEGITKKEEMVRFQMTEEEKVQYLASQHGIEKSMRSLGLTPEHFDPSHGHDVSKFLKQNADSPSRGKALVKTVQDILARDPTTKIVVFADGRIGAGHMVQHYLDESGLGCTCLDSSDDADVERNNESISYYRRADVTDEDRARPRVLVLHFEHAAGLNLQSECFNLILYTPLYVGDGGTTGDAVPDASTEQQAIGRVFRPGQVRQEVNVYRLEMRGPDGEECLDGHLIRRNTDPNVLAAATNTAEEDDDENLEHNNENE